MSRRPRRATGSKARARSRRGQRQTLSWPKRSSATGAPPTVLGLTLKGEAVSARLAAAWAVYPKDLHQALANDLYGRLDENMAGAEEQLWRPRWDFLVPSSATWADRSTLPSSGRIR